MVVFPFIASENAPRVLPNWIATLFCVGYEQVNRSLLIDNAIIITEQV